jgi:ZIP family zinc transporter
MDDGILMVLGLALLPALGNFGGGVLAEWLRPSEKTINRSLHVATGIILAVVAVEVMPEALRHASAWLLALAFLAGGGVHLVLEGGIERWQASKQVGAGVGAWMVYVAVVTDLAGDGLLIGAGSAVSSQMAVILALSQVLADIPEGFAVIANFRDKGVDRAKRLMLSASFVVPAVVTAVLAYFTLREQSVVLKMFGLVFVAGLFTLAAVEDMLREAHESAADSRWSAVSLLVGFALFLVLEGGLG